MTSVKKRETCAIIPAYNEEDNIEEVIAKVKSIEMIPIVIDDHSDDKTVTLAKNSGAIVLRHNKNKGKGEGIKTGLEYALENIPGAKYFVFIDADMQYDPEQAKTLIAPLKKGKSDIVLGYRNWRSVPFRHKVGNFVWRQAFNILFGTRLKDTNCGLMALTRDAVKIVPESMTGGYIIENSILSHAVRKGLRIEQVHVEVSYKHKSGVVRGVRMVGGIMFYIVKEGFKYRLSKI